VLSRFTPVSACRVFLYDPLTTSFIRLTASGILDRCDYTVLKKALSMERFNKKTPGPLKQFRTKSVFYSAIMDNLLMEGDQ
jgi:hypothetical protein